MDTWTKEQVDEELRRRGWYQSERPIQGGIQYLLTDGTPIDWYQSTGKLVVRGRETSLKQEATKVFEGVSRVTPSAVPEVPKVAVQPSPTRVFIVYGHDSSARDELELILRRLKLEPIILQNLPATGETLIERLENLTTADFACVLLTPDDEGYPRGCPEEKKPRARQNVVLELGMVLAKLGRSHVAILVKGDNMERPSDINGLIYIGFQEHVSEITPRLGASLQQAGFNIQVKDLIS